MKTFIAIPCMESTPSLFTQSLAMLQRVDDVVVGMEMGSLVYQARNSLARAAIQAEADQILWLDSDMVFTPDFLIRMNDVAHRNDIDFLSAMYFRRKPPFTPVVFERLDYNEENGHAITTQLLSIPEERFKCGGCGFGGVLMSLDVVMSVAAMFDGRMFDPLPGMGEDLSFCWRARQAGYDIWCDPAMQMGHVGSMVVTKDYFLNYAEEEKK